MRDEALRKLQARLERIHLLDLTHAGQRDKARSLLGVLLTDLDSGELGAALSAPCDICEGKKPIARGKGWASKASLKDFPYVPLELFAKVTPPDKYKRVEILALPADEPQALLASARDVTPPKEES